MRIALRRRISAHFTTALPAPEAVSRLERYLASYDEFVDDVPKARLIGGSVAGHSFRVGYEYLYGKVIVRGRIRQRDADTQVILRFREEPIRPIGLTIYVAIVLAVWWYFLRQHGGFEIDVEGFVVIVFGVAGLFVPRWGTSPGFANAVVAELSTLLSPEEKR